MALDWTLRNTGIGENVYDFKRFLGRIYASGSYGVPYTINDGVDWTMTNYRTPGTNYYCTKAIVHNGRLFVSGNFDNKPVCYYTDDGINWATKVLNTGVQQKGLNFYSIGSRLLMLNWSNLVTGIDSKISYSDDNGVNWSTFSTPIRICYDMEFYAGRYYACGQENYGLLKSVYYTTNPGVVGWVNASTGFSRTYFGKYVRSIKEFDGNLYCCDSLGFVYRLLTPTSWEVVFSGLEDCYYLEVFYGKLYVCGESATLGESSVYSTENGIVWVAEGITSYSDTVYGIWGDAGTRDLWAGTESSRAWVSLVPVPPVFTKSQGAPASGKKTTDYKSKITTEPKLITTKDTDYKSKITTEPKLKVTKDTDYKSKITTESKLITTKDTDYKAKIPSEPRPKPVSKIKVELIGDLVEDLGDLVKDSGLESAIIISLFTDKRATVDDILPDEDSSRRGWWGDQIRPFAEDDEIGSYLWLLERSKTTDEVLSQAKQYAIDALQWMITDKIISKIEVNVERNVNLPNDGLFFNVKLYKDYEDEYALAFEGNWGLQII